MKIAICLDNQKRYEAKTYDNVYYIKDTNGHFMILTKTDKQDVDKIDEGYKYCYYLIDGVIYEGIYTNDVEWYVKHFIRKPQPTLFDY